MKSAGCAWAPSVVVTLTGHVPADPPALIMVTVIAVSVHDMTLAANPPTATLAEPSWGPKQLPLTVTG